MGQSNSKGLALFMHSIWHDGNAHCDEYSCAAVQNEVHALFHCQDLFVCSLKKKRLFSFTSLSAIPSLWRPLIFYTPCLVRQFWISFVNGTANLPFHLGYYGLFFGWQRPATAATTNQPNGQAPPSPNTSGFQALPFLCYECYFSFGLGCRPFRLQLSCPRLADTAM